ncbi:MAG TPA: hypothetical protein PKB14_18105, partial [Rubrivivax sp.]|nr:hypothetical protein [Rubrivivax sp.]
MAYFVPYLDSGGYVLPSVEQLRQEAGSLDGAETVVFGAGGVFYWRIDNPLIGEQFGFLSDVSIVDFGSAGVIANVTDVHGLTLYQVRAPEFGLGLRLDSIQALHDGGLDQVLGAQFPEFQNTSDFDKLVVTPGYSGPSYLNEFYLAASGDRTFDQAYGPLGIGAPNDGRALIVRGSIGGQRDAAWGNWLDVISYGGNEPAAPEPGEYNDIDPSEPDFEMPRDLLPLPSLTIHDPAGSPPSMKALA